MKKGLGIFGWPISHTLSPLMHDTAIKGCGLDYSYTPFSVSPENLSKGVEAIRTLDFKGINVTIPHKENIIPYLDRLDSEAKLIGAVNTVVSEDGALVGYNTDGAGFIESFKAEVGFSPRDKKVILFGAGGAAKGIATSLLSEGVSSLLIVNRSESKGLSLAYKLKTTFGVGVEVQAISLSELSDSQLKSADILINSTSVGMENSVGGLFDYDIISERQIVCDIVYRPILTPLLKAAQLKGSKTVGGLGMLIYQGALSFKLWTGVDMPVNVVRETLEMVLKEEVDG